MPDGGIRQETRAADEHAMTRDAVKVIDVDFQEE